jgi:hypothetical protein
MESSSPFINFCTIAEPSDHMEDLERFDFRTQFFSDKVNMELLIEEGDNINRL